MTSAQVDTFRRRTREVITYWCKHVHVPIYVEGEQVNQDFDIESDCKIVHEEEGTRAVMGFVDSSQGPYGFYNRGLTLKEGEEGEWPHIALKIDSRYLEHTLSRETIMRDENYEKAMKLMDQAVGGPLLEKLVGEIEALVELQSWGHSEVNAYLRLISFLAREPSDSLAGLGDRRICRLVDGRAMTFARMVELWECDALLPVDNPDGLSPNPIDHDRRLLHFQDHHATKCLSPCIFCRGRLALRASRNPRSRHPLLPRAQWAALSAV